MDQPTRQELDEAISDLMTATYDYAVGGYAEPLSRRPALFNAKRDAADALTALLDRLYEGTGGAK